MDRERRIWKVKMQAASGRTDERTVAAFWDPAHALTNESVLVAAKTEAQKDGGEWTALSAELVS